MKDKIFTVQLNNIEAAKYITQLFNSAGQLVYSNQLKLPLSTINSFVIDLKNIPLSNGNYQLVILNEKGFKKEQTVIIAQ